jgi:DUF4097 and DUF4098 domain-containing protein YvlB
MNGKNLTKIGVFWALFIICGLCTNTKNATVDWIRRHSSNIGVFTYGGQSAQVTETQTFDVYPNFQIVSDSGNVEVIAADVTQMEVEMVKTAWAATVEEAEAAAQAMSIRVTEGADTLTLTYNKPEEILIGGWNGSESIDFVVRVPAETSVNLATSFGKVDISGLVGDAKLESDFGDLDVENLTGALEATSSNATITVKQVTAEDGKVSIETSFGSITVEDLTAEDISISSSNGEITAHQLRADNSIEIENQFGLIEVHDVLAASFRADNQNGRITIEAGKVEGLIYASTSFGSVQVTDVEANEYELSTSNGNLTVEGSTGTLAIENSFGEISITEASNASLNVKNSNGTITFSGSLNPTSGHTIETSFGGIHLAIPEDSSFDVILDTSFGQIESELPLSVTGTLSSVTDNNHWEASLNDGGPEFKATSSNGDITIQVLVSK